MPANWLKPEKVLLLLLLCLACPGPALAATLQINAPNEDLHAYVQDIFLSNQARLQQLTGADPPLIIIEIPADLQAFHNRLLQVGAPLWAAGVAMNNHIILRSPRSQGGNMNFARVLLHELSHVYINHAMQGAPVPWWLQEGIAMLAGRQNPGPITMASAVFNRGLLPWTHMGPEFFPRPEQVDLAYAQAFYMSMFLQDKGLLQPLIHGLSRGYSLNRSLHEASGKPLNYWEEQFMQTMNTRFSWMALGASGVLWGAIGLAAAVIVVVRRRAMLRQMRAMDARAGERLIIGKLKINRLYERRIRPLRRPMQKPPEGAASPESCQHTPMPDKNL